MKCCGEERTTNYCPECGGRVRQLNDLECLMLHLAACHSRAVSKHQGEASAKWRAWIEALLQYLPTPAAPEIAAALPEDGLEPDDGSV